MIKKVIVIGTFLNLVVTQPLLANCLESCQDQFDTCRKVIDKQFNACREQCGKDESCKRECALKAAQWVIPCYDKLGSCLDQCNKPMK